MLALLRNNSIGQETGPGECTGGEAAGYRHGWHTAGWQGLVPAILRQGFGGDLAGLELTLTFVESAWQIFQSAT